MAVCRKFKIVFQNYSHLQLKTFFSSFALMYDEPAMDFTFIRSSPSTVCLCEYFFRNIKIREEKKIASYRNFSKLRNEEVSDGFLRFSVPAKFLDYLLKRVNKGSSEELPQIKYLIYFFNVSHEVFSFYLKTHFLEPLFIAFYRRALKNARV